MVTSIKKNKESSMDWTVIETLRDLANQIERGEVEYNKCFVCLLNDEGEFNYSTGFRMSKLKGSEAVSLLEIIKSDLLNGINGMPSKFTAGE
tara:strand:+ start:230 stop:505 length:276 start_codon:yes stop_codon:yes gene_type:complete